MIPLIYRMLSECFNQHTTHLIKNNQFIQKVHMLYAHGRSNIRAVTSTF
jgi:hypothetical protein